MLAEPNLIAISGQRASFLAGGEFPVPVVDGVSSAVRHAETLVALNPGTARAGSFAPPPPEVGATPN